MEKGSQLEVALAAPVPSNSLDHFRSLMAYCDPSIRSYDVSAAATGLVRVELGEQADRRAVERKVRRVAERVATASPPPPSGATRRVAGRGLTWAPDLERVLRDSGQAFALGSGSFALLGRAAALARAFDEDFRAIARRLQGADGHFPTLVGLGFLRRIGYFKSFPHYTTFAAHLQPDVETIDAFMAEAGSPGGKPVIDSPGMAPPDSVLSPTICYHLYNALQDSEVPAAGIRVTAQGRCYRWEAGNMAHLRRLWDFAMRELIWVGPKELVPGEREKAIEATLKYCETLGLEAWIEEANDPFFSPDAGKRSYYQRGFGMKLELRLPFSKSGESLAAASFNNMGRTLTDACAIKLQGGGPAFSGCVGWGAERWVYAFLAQHGCDPTSWPAPMRERLEA